MKMLHILNECYTQHTIETVWRRVETHIIIWFFAAVVVVMALNEPLQPSLKERRHFKHLGVLQVQATQHLIRWTHTHTLANTLEIDNPEMTCIPHHTRQIPLLTLANLAKCAISVLRLSHGVFPVHTLCVICRLIHSTLPHIKHMNILFT